MMARRANSSASRSTSFRVRFVGTGDIFAAVMLGRLVDGVPLQESTHRAMDAVRTMIDRNRDKEDKYLGIPIETCLEVLDE